MSKKAPNATEMWKLLEGGGFIYDAGKKDIQISCEKLDDLLLSDSGLDPIIFFSHVFECGKCMEKHLKERKANDSS